MASAPSSSNESLRVTQIASAFHTILVLALVALWALWSAIHIGQMSQGMTVGRVGLYLRTLVFEWGMFAMVIIGVRRHGSSVHNVLGDRWRSKREFARDAGIAAGFWIISTIALSAINGHSHSGPTNSAVMAILPSGWAESVLWIALSVSAGICEEVLHRGYLQRQLIAWTSSAAAGIALSAAVFGLSHLYQGWPAVIRIGVGGAMLGVLAHWRRSVRPGMMAHAFGDSFAGIGARLLKIRIA